jgi:hypothetical protein
MKDAKKSKALAPKRGRPSKFGDDRQIVGARLPADLYQKLVEASAANRTSLSAEIERRVAQSFEADPATDPATSDDVVQDLFRHVMAAFKEGGRRESRNRSMDGKRELPEAEWIEDHLSYTEAAARAVEALADEHPKPLYGQCLRMIYVFRARLDRGWQRLLLDLSIEDARAEKKRARELVESMAPAPSLLDPLYHPPIEKDES